MSTNIQQVEKHAFTRDNNILIDANVWIHIYGPQTPSKKTRIYSSVLKKILEAGSNIFIDVLVLSEFINRCARIELRIKDPTGRIDFKEWRNTDDYKPVANSIAGICRRIVKDSNRLESGFSTTDIHALMSDFENKSKDFNDLVLVQICKTRQLILLTDDGDFRDENSIKILTANQRLLN